MHARQYFAVLKATKAIHVKIKYNFLHELIPLMHIPSQKVEYAEKLAASYKNLFTEKLPVERMSIEDQLRHNRNTASRLHMILGSMGLN